MGVCLGIYFEVFTLTHAFGFDFLRSESNAPIVFYPTGSKMETASTTRALFVFLCFTTVAVVVAAAKSTVKPNTERTVASKTNESTCIDCEGLYFRQNITCASVPSNCGDCLDGYFTANDDASSANATSDLAYACTNKKEEHVEPKDTRLIEPNKPDPPPEQGSALPVLLPLGIIACMVGIGVVGHRVFKNNTKKQQHAPLNPRRTAMHQFNAGGGGPRLPSISATADQADGVSSDEEIFDVRSFNKQNGGGQAGRS
jgi:hypothetical protein